MSKVIASTYEIVEKIGAGGGGNVYLANHLRLGKKVVLKADKRKITTRPELLRREVDILKDLRNSYIPQVYDYFVEDGVVYTVMDFIEGESLDKPLKRGERFSQPQVIQWAKQLLEALCYLHSETHGDPPRGFVHGDIKPANLMRTPYNNICLIDFNIALALGEENIVGRSAGYASPEHYGLDYSIVGSSEKTSTDGSETIVEETETVYQQTDTAAKRELQSKTVLKKIMPDVRSDIYSVGATLYHLLSGKRPEKSAVDVTPLSETEFSPQVIKIISKAMNPNPDLRYQTAEEMLYDFMHLQENDPRMIRWKRKGRIACGILTAFLCAGITMTFVGLKRIQAVESGLKLTEYSQNALTEGDQNLAIRYALEAIPEKTDIITPKNVPEAQKVLTDALGVYDLTDGFKKQEILDLPKNPLCLTIAPDGMTAACFYENSVAVIDLEKEEILTTLPAVDSASAEVEYLDRDTIIYAGENGICAYSISEDTELWKGEPATSISISHDGRLVAAVYRDDTEAVIYDAVTGQKRKVVDFEGKKQDVTMVSDSFADPGNNLFEISSDGSLLAVSFADGSLTLFSLQNDEDGMSILDEQSGYSYFEGGFYGDYLAFSASNAEKSIFAVVDGTQKQQTVGMESDSTFHARTDKNGVYVQVQNILVEIEPETGEQTPLVTTNDTIDQFAVGDNYIAITTANEMQFFDSNAKLIGTVNQSGENKLLVMTDQVVLYGQIDTSVIHILKYEDHAQNEILKYEDLFDHDEARLSADGNTVMLFGYKQFCIYDLNGNVISEVMLPNPDEVYDQQFIRKENTSYLEVTYRDGKLLTYDAKDGSLVSESITEKPDMTLNEEFITTDYRIEAPLHGTPQVYDKETGKKYCELNENAYLTYVTQMNDYLITQYVTAEGVCYGMLLNDKCETLAYLPYLCDIVDGELYFDIPLGSIRKTCIYELESLCEMAQGKLDSK